MALFFPEDISYGSVKIAGFKTTILETNNGFETRNANWKNSRRRYNVREGARSQDLIEKLVTFHDSTQGALKTFNYKDWSDFKSTSLSSLDISNTNQYIGTGDGVETVFQLIKTYSPGRQRDIKKPKEGTVIVSVNGFQTFDFTTNYLTGEITFNTAPSSGADIKAGYEFYINCRFNEDDISMTLTTYNIAQSDITLVEVRE